MRFDITCEVCKRVLGSSSEPQRGFTCGNELKTHANGDEIAPQEPLNDSQMDTLKREVENLRREIELIKSFGV
jgi:hypothetical protein